MNTEELRTGLREAGLSAYQIDAYVTLLDLGTTPATELAERADVPRSRIYDVLRDLEEEGYVETFKQNSLQARAREPTEVFEKLRSRAERLSKTAAEIRNRWQQADVGSHRISVLKRVDTVVERAREAIRNATNQVQVSASPEQFEKLAPDLRVAAENGAFVSVSFNTSPTKPARPPEPSALDGVVTEARHRNLPAPFLVLVDRGMTCYAPHMNPVEQYGAVFEDETLTYIFHWYFEAALWESWPVVYSGRTDSLPAEYVDIRKCIRDVAPLLADGATVVATIRGKVRGERRSVTLGGQITDVLYANDTEGRRSTTPTLSALAGQATIILESDGVEYGVGGWGAVLEDLEAERIVIESVDYPEEGDA